MSNFRNFRHRNFGQKNQMSRISKMTTEPPPLFLEQESLIHINNSDKIVKITSISGKFYAVPKLGES